MSSWLPDFSSFGGSIIFAGVALLLRVRIARLSVDAPVLLNVVESPIEHATIATVVAVVPARGDIVRYEEMKGRNIYAAGF